MPRAGLSEEERLHVTLLLSLLPTAACAPSRRRLQSPLASVKPSADQTHHNGAHREGPHPGWSSPTSDAEATWAPALEKLGSFSRRRNPRSRTSAPSIGDPSSLWI